jgi:methionine-rich copper-binding protein CopC
MKRLITALSLTFVLSLGLVFAHSEFESSVPEDGAALDTAPTEVVINFENNIQPTFSVFKVYAIPEDVLADAEMMPAESEPHAESETRSETQAHSETENQASSEGETATSASTDEHTHNESEHSEGEHSESGEHGVMDRAAEMLIPTVIDLSGDEAARADTGLAATQDMAKSVTINLKENLAPGAYVAMFRVLSEDTHVVEGFITFEIAGE